MVERDHATVEAPGSIPGFRSIDVLSRASGISWRVCFGTTVMHAPHKCRGDWDVRRGDARVVQRVSALVVHPTLALEHNRDEMSHETNKSPRRAHASGAEIGRNDWAAPEPVTGHSLGV